MKIALAELTMHQMAADNLERAEIMRPDVAMRRLWVAHGLLLSLRLVIGTRTKQTADADPDFVALEERWSAAAKRLGV